MAILRGVHTSFGGIFMPFVLFSAIWFAASFLVVLLLV